MQNGLTVSGIWICRNNDFEQGRIDPQGMRIIKDGVAINRLAAGVLRDYVTGDVAINRLAAGVLQVPLNPPGGLAINRLAAGVLRD